VKLTDTVARNATLSQGRTDIILFDDKLACFGLRVRQAKQGITRQFIVQYRDALQKDRRFIVGSVNEVSAAKARETAAKLIAGIRLGIYPHVEREKARKEAEQELDRAKQTFGSISALYLERQARELRPKSYEATVYHITKSWAPIVRRQSF
jgi:hypothetical protein